MKIIFFTLRCTVALVHGVTPPVVSNTACVLTACMAHACIYPTTAKVDSIYWWI